LANGTDGRTLRANEVREARRAQILDTALGVFADQGYHQTSISDVVKAAGVARGTFYLYFESKSQIFLHLLDNLLGHLRSSVRGVDVGQGAPPVTEQLQRTVERILETAVNNRPLTRVIFRVAVGLDPEVDERLTAFYSNLHQYIAQSLERGQQMGIVRQMDVGVASRCILGSIRQVVDAYVVQSDAQVDVGAVAQGILDFNLQGVTNQ
jgi:AcrR family transcriptional regulator